MRGVRALLALTIAMGVLIVIGTTGLIVVVVHRLTHPHPASLTQRVLVSDAPPMTALQDEPAGTHVTALARQSDTTLAIALSGGGPDRVLILDVVNGRVLTEMRLGR